MKTINWKIVTGISEGYFHNVEGIAKVELTEKIGALWEKLAADEMESGGAYVPAVVSPGAVFYRPEWGCPKGGESVVVLTGVCNPQFSTPEEYKRALIRVAKKLKKELKQSTLTIEMWESEIEYLTD